MSVALASQALDGDDGKFLGPGASGPGTLTWRRVARVANGGAEAPPSVGVAMHRLRWH